MIVVATSRQTTVQVPSRHPSWKPTLVTVLVTFAALFSLGAVIASPVAPVQLSLQLPMFSTAGWINHLTLVVSNHSRKSFSPRFAVQSIRTGMNPLPWSIEAGPLTLHSGETATYQLTTLRDDRAFFAHEAVQLVVTDSGGDYTLRGVLTIQPDHSYMWPDAIPNPDYRVWDPAPMTPIFWAVVGNGTVEPVSIDGKNAVRLAAAEAPQEGRRVALANTILFPRAPFGIWLRPPVDDPRVAYGLEILSGDHRLWILFGPQAYTGPVDNGTFVINRLAPAGIGTYEQVDLQAAFAEAGWSLPALQRTLFSGIYMDARLVDLHLLFASQDPAINAAVFGPISQGDYRLAPQTRMADVLDDPAGYYVRLGEAYLSGQNTWRALEAYERALDFAPGDADILARITSLKQRLAEEGQ